MAIRVQELGYLTSPSNVFKHRQHPSELLQDTGAKVAYNIYASGLGRVSFGGTSACSRVG